MCGTVEADLFALVELVLDLLPVALVLVLLAPAPWYWRGRGSECVAVVLCAGGSHRPVVVPWLAPPGAAV